MKQIQTKELNTQELKDINGGGILPSIIGWLVDEIVDLLPNGTPQIG